MLCRQSRCLKKEEHVFAKLVRVGTGEGNGIVGNSNDVGITCGSKNGEATVDSCFDESQGLGGCLVAPALFKMNGDHPQKTQLLECGNVAMKVKPFRSVRHEQKLCTRRMGLRSFWKSPRSWLFHW